jgi:hypothetical protein
MVLFFNTMKKLEEITFSCPPRREPLCQYGRPGIPVRNDREAAA